MEVVFRIRHAAKLAGINPTLLRAWERRYHLVAPRRTESGYRVYSAEDIEVLRAAAQLVAAGHTISEVARLPRGELLAAAGQVDGAAASPAPTSAQTSPPPPPPPSGEREILEAAVAEALGAIARFDRPGFEGALFPITSSFGFTPDLLCQRVLLPLLRAIGDAWERGHLSVAAEHFGSALCRTKILQYLEFAARGAEGPRVVCACPEREQHEGGLLAFAVHAAVSRWQVVYLGAQTPLAEALDTALRVGADLLALSFTMRRTLPEIEALGQAVAAARRVRPGLRVLAGGAATLLDGEAFARAGVQICDRVGVNLQTDGDHPSSSAARPT